MDERIGFGLYQSCGDRGSVGHVSLFWLRWCGGVGGEWVGGLDQGRERWGGVMSVLGERLDSLCRWQVQVSVYCVWRIPAHLRCTQCSILLHLMDICFLTSICLWQISQIQTCLFKVVGPGLVSTSPAFVSSSVSHLAAPHGRHVQKTVNRALIGREDSTQFAQQLESAVTAPPLVGGVVWSLFDILLLCVF